MEDQTIPEQEPPFIPWQHLMAFGFGVLHLNSDDFWKMTLPEIIIAARSAFPMDGAPLTRTSFVDLMDRFPDREVDVG